MGIVGRVLLAASLLVALAVPAAGDSQTVLDSDDSESPTDVVAARHRHARRDTAATPGHRTRERLWFRIVTYEAWSHEAIDGHEQFITFEINKDQDDEIERCVVVRAHTPGEAASLGYSASIYERCIYFDDDKLVASYGTEHVTRPDTHSLRVHVPKRALLGQADRAYRWRAATAFTDENPGTPCSEPDPHHDGGYGECHDFTRWVRHRL